MRRGLLAFALAIAVLVPVGYDRAEAAVYWTNNPSVGRVNVDGSQSLWPLPSGWFPALEARGACGLDVDDQHLYWGDASGGAVGRASIDGTSPNQAFIPGLGSPCGVVATATHIYWADFATNLIGRASLDGSNVEPAFVAGASRPCGVAVDGGHVYWTNQTGGSIGRADLNGGGVDQEFVSGLGFPCGLDVGGGYLYWGDQDLGSIGRAALDGSGALPVFIPQAGEPWDVALGDSHVFWADRWGTPVNPDGGIGRAALDGSSVNHDLVPGIHSPTGVAADSRLLAPPSVAPRPSDYLRFGKLTHNSDGSVRLIVYVPARGEFNVLGPKIGWSIDKGNPPPELAGVFRWKLKLWPGKRTKAAKRIHRQLRRKGRAPILLRMTYQQEGRLPLEGVKRFAFTRP